MEALTEVERLFTLREAAVLLGVSYWTVYELVRKGKIRAVKTPSGRWRIPKSAMEEYFKQLFQKEEVV
ncbi:MAG: hypothetical protein DRP01_01930 [Archaeoglobales archaeon]|nr:MAG: hypothetical protein DRP01_01930 [Archaeoglobales archaeon]